MKEIPLTKGRVALVDDEDYELISQFTWHYTTRGYAMRSQRIGRIHKVGILMHRYIMSAPKDMHVDHINGDTLDNRRCNLRLASPSQNQHNKRKTKLYNTSSRFKGVTWHKHNKKWQAAIGGKGRQTRYIGQFTTQEEAARAYDAAALHLFGEFAHINFPDESTGA